MSFGWQSMLQVTKTVSKRLTLSTENETTESVQNNSTTVRQPPVPPLSASFSLFSTSSPTSSVISHFGSSSVKLFLSKPSVSIFIFSSTESSPTSLSLSLATSTVHVTFWLSSSQSFTSLTPVSSSLTSTLLSSSSSKPLASSRELMTSPSLLSLPLFSTSTTSSLFLSSTSSVSTSSVSSSSSLSSTPPLSSSLIPSSSLSTTVPFLSSSPLLATPVPSSFILSSLSSTSISSSLIPSSLSSTSIPSSLIPSSLSSTSISSSLIPSSLSSTSISSSLIPSSLQLSMSPTLAWSSLPSSPSSLGLLIPSSSLSSTSISSSLIPSSLQLSMSPTSAWTSLPSSPSSLGLLIPSSSSTPGSSIAMTKSLLSTTPSSSLIPSLQFSSRSSIVTSSNVQLTKNDTVAKTILPSKTLLVQQTSSPPSGEPHIKEIFLAILDGNCSDVTSRESFETAFMDTLTNLIGLQSDAIDILDIRCGSVKVLFSVIHKQASKIAEVLDKLIKEERMNIVFNGKIYRAISIMSLHPTAARPTAITPSIINPTINVLTARINERRLVKILFILFVSIFGALALFGVVVCIAKICGRRRYSRLRLKTSTLSSRGTNQIYKNELELIRMSPLHRYADYYGETNQEPHRKEDSDDEDNINNRTALLNMLRNGEIASRRGKIMVKDDDSYSSIAFY